MFSNMYFTKQMLLLTMVIIGFHTARSQTWQTVGTVGFTSPDVRHADIQVDNNDVPYVAFSDSLYGYKATVMKFDGTNWVSVGAPGFSLGPASHLDFMSLAFDSNNTPYISYEDSSLTAKAVVRKFDGTNWIPVGTEGFSNAQAGSVAIAIDTNDVPYVVFKDYYSGGKAMVMKFDGTNWVMVGGTYASIVNADHTWIRIDSDNNPIVGFIGSGSADMIKFDGTMWSYIGGPDFIGYTVFYTYTVLNHNYQPYMICNYFTPFVYPFYMRGDVYTYDGSSWGKVEPTSFPDYVGPGPKLAFDSHDTPCVVYSDSTNGFRTAVVKYDGMDWVTVGTPGFSDGPSAFPGITIDSNDKIYVSYSDLSLNAKLTVKSFDLSSGIAANWGESNGLNVYPNPSSTVLTIQCNAAIADKNSIVQIFDASARLVLEQRLDNHELKLNTEVFSSGFYYIKVSSKESELYKKLVIQH